MRWTVCFRGGTPTTRIVAANLNCSVFLELQLKMHPTLWCVFDDIARSVETLGQMGGGGSRIVGLLEVVSC